MGLPDVVPTRFGSSSECYEQKRRMKQAEKNRSVRSQAKTRVAGLATGTAAALWLLLQTTLGSLPAVAQSNNQSGNRAPLTYSELLKKIESGQVSRDRKSVV